MSFKKFIISIYKIFCCQCVSCVLWNEFSHIHNWSEKDLKDFNERENELRSK